VTRRQKYDASRKRQPTEPRATAAQLGRVGNSLTFPKLVRPAADRHCARATGRWDALGTVWRQEAILGPDAATGRFSASQRNMEPRRYRLHKISPRMRSARSLYITTTFLAVVLGVSAGSMERGSESDVKRNLAAVQRWRKLSAEQGRGDHDIGIRMLGQRQKENWAAQLLFVDRARWITTPLAPLDGSIRRSIDVTAQAAVVNVSLQLPNKIAPAWSRSAHAQTQRLSHQSILRPSRELTDLCRLKSSLRWRGDRICCLKRGSALLATNIAGTMGRIICGAMKLRQKNRQATWPVRSILRSRCWESSQKNSPATIVWSPATSC
jgi:hypothetical protein